MQKERRPLCVVGAPRFEAEVFDVTRHSLVQSFHGWLEAVEPIEELNMSAPAVVIDRPLRIDSRRALRRALQLCPPLEAEPDLDTRSTTFAPHKMTTQDYVTVMLATVREGHHHARWPKEVVESFLAAEIVNQHESTQ